MTAPTCPAPPSAESGLRWGRLVGQALRLAIMLAIAAAGLMLLQTYREMLHDAPTAAPLAPPTPPTIPAADFAPPDLLQPGAWSLGESDWTVTLMNLESAEGEARLRSLGFRGTIDDKPSSLEDKVLAWLKWSRPALVDGCRVYDVPAGNVRVRAVTRMQGGGERLQLVQGIWRRGDALQLLEAMPARAIRRAGAEEDHLLPLPSGVSSLARRWSTSGPLCCEILGPTRWLEEHLQKWSAAGWSAEQPLRPNGSSPYQVLRNGDRVVYLCSVPDGAHGFTYLLLTAQLPNPQGNP